MVVRIRDAGGKRMALGWYPIAHFRGTRWHSACSSARWGNRSPGVSNDRPAFADVAEVQAVLGRALASYADIAGRFGPFGGLERVFALYEQMRTELDRVQFGEIDGTTQVIKGAIETLLRMDYELRKLNNLKLALGGGKRDGD